MDEWRGMESAPRDGTPLVVRFECGREVFAEFITPPPVEIDPEQTFGGWNIECDALYLGMEDLPGMMAWRLDARPSHLTDPNDAIPL